MYRGRFAPSPTGDLHLGSAASALVAWLAARQEGGVLVLRVEDIDAPRVIPGCEAEQLCDLRWLGLDWDEGPDVGGPFGPYRQSERGALYDEALASLRRLGATYLCDCSRAEIARVASAPHPGEEGPPYPGTCRDLPQERELKRPGAVRLRVARRTIAFVDRFQGAANEDVRDHVGDFVLRRGDGVYAYQLAVVVDDDAMRISEVVRGADLLGSTARQIVLAEMLGGAARAHAHHPLLVGPDGARLAKRARGIGVADFRRGGVRPETVIGALAHALGLIERPEPMKPRDLIDADLGRLAAKLTVPVRPGLGLIE
jgi:glutamyl-tRNA synthetase